MATLAENHERTMSISTSTWRKFISKWVSEFIPTGKNLQRWRLRAHGNCPFCLEESETTDHILSCQHSDATMFWNQHLYTYIIALSNLGFPLDVLIPLKRELDAWRNNMTPPCLETYPMGVRAIIQGQRTLG